MSAKVDHYFLVKTSHRAYSYHQNGSLLSALHRLSAFRKCKTGIQGSDESLVFPQTNRK